ncbi:hypothetical protein D3C76_1047700 [compost metagenome]
MILKKVSPLLVSLVLMLLFSSSAFAENSALSNIEAAKLNVNPTVIYDEEELKANFDELGIDEQTQKTLLEKLKGGEMLDSINPTKQHEGITTKVSNQEIGLLAQPNSPFLYTRTVFPDGSVSIQSVTPGEGTICGSGYCNYQNAKVYYSNTVVTASFLANFTIVNGGFSYISDAWQPSVKTFISTSFSDLNLAITRPTETLQYSAQASMTWIFSSAAGSTNQYLNLDVKDGVGKSTPN